MDEGMNADGYGTRITIQAGNINLLWVKSVNNHCRSSQQSGSAPNIFFDSPLNK